MCRLCFSETFNVCFFPFRRQTLHWNGAAVISFVGCLAFHSDIQLWLSYESI